MYNDIVQTAILLTLLWLAILFWAVSYALYKIVGVIRFFTRPRATLKVTRKDFNLPFIQYVAANIVLRYFFRKGR